MIERRQSRAREAIPKEYKERETERERGIRECLQVKVAVSSKVATVEWNIQIAGVHSMPPTCLL